MEINKYKLINVQTLQSQTQDSLEYEKAHEETQGQDNHKSRKASAPGFAAPDPSTALAQKLLQKKFYQYP